MENKQTAPSEIYLTPTYLEYICPRQTRNSEADIKYLSETHVQELLAEKEREIEQLKKQLEK